MLFRDSDGYFFNTINEKIVRHIYEKNWISSILGFLTEKVIVISHVNGVVKHALFM